MWRSLLKRLVRLGIHGRLTRAALELKEQKVLDDMRVIMGVGV